MTTKEFEMTVQQTEQVDVCNECGLTEDEVPSDLVEFEPGYHAPDGAGSVHFHIDCLPEDGHDLGPAPSLEEVSSEDYGMEHIAYVLNNAMLTVWSIASAAVITGGGAFVFTGHFVTPFILIVIGGALQALVLVEGRDVAGEARDELR